MGVCCYYVDKADKNEFIVPDRVNEDVKSKGVLNKNRMAEIMEFIIINQYERTKKEQSNLQKQRVEILKQGLTEKYVESIKELKEFETKSFEDIEKNVVRQNGIKINDYNNAKNNLDMKEIMDNAIKNNSDKLKESIRNKNPVFNENRLRTLYKDKHDSCSSMISSNPIIARELLEIYTIEDYISHIDILTADKLYDEFKLLPLEIQLFI